MPAGRDSLVERVLAAEVCESDGDLIRRAQTGDRAAFGSLVERYMKRAYYSALGLVGSPEDAMDLSQDAFARAFRARQSIDPDRPFFAWLYQIVRRLCFNFNRDRKSRREKLRDASRWLAEEAETRAPAPGPSRALEKNELCRTVRHAIEELAEREREVLVLKEFEGLRYREIAELVGIPIGTVMSRLYTARKHLAAALALTAAGQPGEEGG
jgi:RNA polymerase sigma-70 factor (ECF subfamily)